MIGYEVTLTCELLRYHPGLVQGIKGHVVGMSRLGDRFAIIRFPSINHTIDILWESLDITDPRHIEKQAQKARELQERMPKMTNIVYTRGPLGRFDNIKYQYLDNNSELQSEKCIYKEEGLKLLEYFDQNKMPYTTNIFPPAKPRKQKAKTKN